MPTWTWGQFTYMDPPHHYGLIGLRRIFASENACLKGTPDPPAQGDVIACHGGHTATVSRASSVPLKLFWIT